MRRRMLRACLLAYPRTQRRRDGAFLHDLALDLAEHHGWWRQIGSLVSGGLVERARNTRRRLSHRPGPVIAAIVAAIIAVVALPVAAVERVEDDRFTCSTGPGCATTEATVEARERSGWACTRHDTGSTTPWRCTLERSR